MKYAYKRFTDYEDFVQFLNEKIPGTGWDLESWQDIGGNDGIDIRAVFHQLRRYSSTPFPEGL